MKFNFYGWITVELFGICSNYVQQNDISIRPI